MKYDLTKKPTKGAARALDAFRGALLGLVARKSFESVSTSEVCEEAGYPRATFYNYFDDKYDLLNYCWVWLAGQMGLGRTEHEPRNQALYDIYDRMAGFTEKHAGAIRAIRVHNDEAGYLCASFHTFMAAQAREIFRDCPYAAESPVPADLLADHYTQTIMLVWQHCCLDGAASRAKALSYLEVLLGDL
ncbi:MAG: TetR/AcrR family transcriptional regulator [Coriobacteriia bacterium]|nr:TetR/AcrR family transcriptional regulator [Coriobacteriia bacterium]